MSHAYSRNYLHIVFSTKERRRSISPPVRDKLWGYLRGIADGYGIETHAIGGTDDHVHILVNLAPKISASVLIRALKANSSKWMNDTGHLFAWQQGYAALSVSASNLASVRSYINNPPEHHKKRSFEEEFKALLRRHGINFTPEHVLG